MFGEGQRQSSLSREKEYRKERVREILKVSPTSYLVLNIHAAIQLWNNVNQKQSLQNILKITVNVIFSQSFHYVLFIKSKEFPN